MTTYDDREKGFERKFAHDEELAFKTTARRNRLLGLWAAEKMGLKDQAAQDYAKQVVMADFDSPGEDDVAGRLLKDLEKKGVKITIKEVRSEMERLLPIARSQIEGNH